MKRIRIHLVAAARPNFMKIAPLYHAFIGEPWAECRIVHTGQHYDVNMSDSFFKDLRLPEPDIHLGIGGGSHAEQTGRVMIAYEGALLEDRPDLVIVVGDVNSTLACTLAAVKISYNSAQHSDLIGKQRDSARPIVAHLEAGLRSRDRTMPEEINRIVTDALADILWTPSPDADENLLNEGIPEAKICRVGNIMIDSLEMLRPRIVKESTLNELGLQKGEYALVTLHRPSNVDDPATLGRICRGLSEISKEVRMVFPVHPRTRKNLERFGLMDFLQSCSGIMLTEPLSYVPFMNLVFNSQLILTDSGGIQEETTYLGIPCLTLRSSTERPITVEQGTNRLTNPDRMVRDVFDALHKPNTNYSVPELWDGKTASRVVKSIGEFFRL